MKSSHRAARPIFVDRSGLRRRRVVMAGAAVATTLVTGLVVLVVGFFGSSAGHVPGFPGADAPAAATPSARRTTGSTGAPSDSPVPTATATPRPASTPTTSAASPSPTTKRHYPSHPPRPTKSR